MDDNLEITEGQDQPSQDMDPQQAARQQTLQDQPQAQDQTQEQASPAQRSRQKSSKAEDQQVQDAEKLDPQSLKRVIEALIFACDKPVTLKQIKDIVGNVDARDIRKAVDDLKDEYTKSERSFDIQEIAGGFQFATNPAYGRWLKKLYNIKQSDYLTGPGLETLAIIAYKQPVTKTDIEFVRGVSVDGVINNLLEKGFLKIAGRKEVPGRPFLYATTSLFLQYFGLNSLEELPLLPEFKEADLVFQSKDNAVVVENTEAGAQDNTGGENNGESKEVTQ